ncbi:hypothetical protein Zmor_017061 [Zophobas morio]|uniref:Uncharacterized protein n=1 Tax=Zophobas morio TaxID=2755281 RepID=A0AA38MCD9_9CUCU|nr:hypothetical protein Zmor_017061 [Zophobas morio]
MKYCSVPGCKSKLTKKPTKTFFFSLPTDETNGQVDPLKHKRRQEWVKAIRGLRLPESTLQNAVVCSKHFVSGHPASEQDVYHKDWVPSLHLPQIVLDQRKIVDVIIETLPDVIVQFDVPDLIILDKVKFNEKQIEMDLIHKYITNPVCDENGYYNDDHDYLGLPVLPTKTESVAMRQELSQDHSYSITDRPACLYFDSRHFCNICAYNFNNLFSFNNHMMVHTVKNDVMCFLCEQTFLTTTCLNNHLNVHTCLCDKCGVEVPTMQLRAHLLVNQKQKYQNRDILKYRIPQKKKVYFCVLCMKRFFTKQQYGEHAFMHNRVKWGRGRI